MRFRWSIMVQLASIAIIMYYFVEHRYGASLSATFSSIDGRSPMRIARAVLQEKIPAIRSQQLHTDGLGRLFTQRDPTVDAYRDPSPIAPQEMDIAIMRAELLSLGVPLTNTVATFPYSRELFATELRKCQPVVFKKFYSGPTVDMARVKSKLGKMKIPVKTGDYGDPKYGGGDRKFYANTQMQTTMQKYIETVIESDKPLGDGESIPYAGNIACDQGCVERLLGAPLEFPMYERMRPVSKFWVSKNGTLTPLHRDSADNLIVQLYGTKKWTLFPVRKDISDKLYYNKSPVAASERALILNVHDPDLKAFPAYGDIMDLKVEVTMEAGDLLFLPIGWGHAVSTESTSVMLNCWSSKPRSIYEFTNQPEFDVVNLLDTKNMEQSIAHNSGSYTFDGTSGVVLTSHMAVSAQFSIILDVELSTMLSSGFLVAKANNHGIFWGLSVTANKFLVFHYRVQGSFSQFDMDWNVKEIFDKKRHVVALIVDHTNVTLVIDKQVYPTRQIVNIINDCPPNTRFCSLTVGQVQQSRPSRQVFHQKLASVTINTAVLHRTMAL